jgi:hypothetical protein
MNKIRIVLASLAALLIFAQSRPASAEVLVNNVLSPFTAIQVGPGYRTYQPSSWWVHDPRQHQRCYRRWDAYYGHWHMHCVRMSQGHEPYYAHTGRYGHDSHHGHGQHYGHGPHLGYGSPYYEYGPFYKPYYRHGPE